MRLLLGLVSPKCFSLGCAEAMYLENRHPENMSPDHSHWVPMRVRILVDLLEYHLVSPIPVLLGQGRVHRTWVEGPWALVGGLWTG